MKNMNKTVSILVAAIFAFGQITYGDVYIKDKLAVQAAAEKLKQPAMNAERDNLVKQLNALMVALHNDRTKGEIAVDGADIMELHGLVRSLNTLDILEGNISEDELERLRVAVGRVREICDVDGAVSDQPDYKTWYDLGWRGIVTGSALAFGKNQLIFPPRLGATAAGEDETWQIESSVAADGLVPVIKGQGSVPTAPVGDAAGKVSIIEIVERIVADQKMEQYATMLAEFKDTLAEAREADYAALAARADEIFAEIARDGDAKLREIIAQATIGGTPDATFDIAGDPNYRREERYGDLFPEGLPHLIDVVIPQPTEPVVVLPTIPTVAGQRFDAVGEGGRRDLSAAAAVAHEAAEPGQVLSRRTDEIVEVSALDVEAVTSAISGSIGLASGHVVLDNAVERLLAQFNTTHSQPGSVMRVEARNDLNRLTLTAVTVDETTIKITHWDGSNEAGDDGHSWPTNTTKRDLALVITAPKETVTVAAVDGADMDDAAQLAAAHNPSPSQKLIIMGEALNVALGGEKRISADAATIPEGTEVLITAASFVSRVPFGSAYDNTTQFNQAGGPITIVIDKEGIEDASEKEAAYQETEGKITEIILGLRGISATVVRGSIESKVAERAGKKVIVVAEEEEVSGPIEGAVVVACPELLTPEAAGVPRVARVLTIGKAITAGLEATNVGVVLQGDDLTRYLILPASEAALTALNNYVRTALEYVASL